MDGLGRNGQLKEIELKLHPDIKEPLKKLCDNPKTTIVVLSGSDRTVLDDVHTFFLQSSCNCFSLGNYVFGLTTSYAELWPVQPVAGSRKWDIFTSHKGRMDDNHARKFIHGLGWECQGSHNNYILFFVFFIFLLNNAWKSFDFKSKTCDAGFWYQHVFEYFTERTPRSHLELRETSLVWNYKYAGKCVPNILLFCQLGLFFLVMVLRIVWW